jgi:hypothetical protein
VLRNGWLFFDRMDSHTFRDVVIDAGKDGHRTFGLGEGRSRVRAPHLIRASLTNITIVPSWGCCASAPDAAKATAVGALAATVAPGPSMSARLLPQPSPDLAITLGGEHWFGEELTNLHHQFLRKRSRHWLNVAARHSIFPLC